MKNIVKYRFIIRLRNLLKEGIQQVSYSASHFEKEFPFELMEDGQEDEILQQYKDFFKKVIDIAKEYEEIQKLMEQELGVKSEENDG